MTTQKQNQPPVKGQRIPDRVDQTTPNAVTEGGGARQYESGKNPAMQAQQSDRQGSQKPTQQRPEDR